eukprot:jgi/Picre1/31112/NNA_006466.t1
MWVKRQRVTRAAGQLLQRDLQFLERMGFEFGDLAQVTEEWETRFDMLVDWVLWHGESGETFSVSSIDDSCCLRRPFRDLKLFIQVGEMLVNPRRKRNGFVAWETVYVIEKRRLDMRRPPDGRGNPFSSQRSSNVSDGDARESSRASIARKQVVNTVSSRRQAASSPFSEDPGLDFWLSRQRWLWRKTKLDPERVKMLQLAGIDMDTYKADDWRRRAHMAAEALQGTHIQLPGLEYGVVSHMRIKVIHWAETQRALFLDGRLSPGQLRYMTFLGLTWVLSEKVVSADDADWLKKWTSLRDHVVESGSEDNCSMELRDWLVQQRGLTYLRLLSEKRRSKLQSLGISLEVQKPLKEELEWNSRLSQVLAHTQEVGHPGVTPENETFSGLHNWIEDCKGMIQQGQLAPGRIAQLKSLSRIPLLKAIDGGSPLGTPRTPRSPRLKRRILNVSIIGFTLLMVACFVYTTVKFYGHDMHVSVEARETARDYRRSATASKDSKMYQACQSDPTVYVPYMKGFGVISDEVRALNGSKLQDIVIFVDDFYHKLERDAPCSLDLELVLEKFTDWNDPNIGLYPFNAVRNRALKMVETESVMLLDADFMPSKTLSLFISEKAICVQRHD